MKRFNTQHNNRKCKASRIFARTCKQWGVFHKIVGEYRPWRRESLYRWQFTMDLLYIRLAYWTKDSQQHCSRFSSWSFLWCSGLWLTACLLHGSPLLCLSFMVWQFVCNFGIAERNFLLIACVYSCFYSSSKFCLLFPFLSHVCFTLNIFFILLSTLYSHIQ